MSERERIRIAFLVDFLRTDRAGTEKQLMILLRNLPRNRFEPSLFCLQRSQFVEAIHAALPGVQIGILDGYADISRSLPALLRLFRILRRLRPDILHTFFPASNSVGAIVGHMAGVSRIVTSRRDMGFWMTGKDLVLTRIANRFVSMIVANAEAVRNMVIETEKCAQEMVKVIYNALETGEEAGVAGIPNGDGPVVGLVANLNRLVKRGDLYVEAAAIVKKTFPSARFWIVGEGNLRPILEERASGLGLGSSLEFLGRRADVHRLVRRMNVGVVCSDSEGFSNAIMEYMYAGVPVVATDVGGNPELICEGVTGHLVPSSDAMALAKGIIEILEDDSKAKSMGLSGRKRIISMCSKERTIGETVGLYEMLMSERR